MIWLYLALAFLFVWGGMLAIRPSPAQRRLAEIRQRAMGLGLRVTLGSQLKLDTRGDLSRLTAYRRQRPRVVPGARGLLLRDGNGRVLEEKGCFTRRQNEALEACLNALPEGCTLLVSSATEVLVGWDESGSLEDVERIAEQLSALQDWTRDHC